MKPIGGLDAALHVDNSPLGKASPCRTLAAMIIILFRVGWCGVNNQWQISDLKNKYSSGKNWRTVKMHGLSKVSLPEPDEGTQRCAPAAYIQGKHKTSDDNTLGVHEPKNTRRKIKCSLEEKIVETFSLPAVVAKRLLHHRSFQGPTRLPACW